VERVEAVRTQLDEPLGEQELRRRWPAHPASQLEQEMDGTFARRLQAMPHVGGFLRGRPVCASLIGVFHSGEARAKVFRLCCHDVGIDAGRGRSLRRRR
jgi:hypothetical protein